MALQVAQGKIAEPAAVEVLFRSLARLETSGKVEDRYLSFYG
jgi:hypothetical protein